MSQSAANDLPVLRPELRLLDGAPTTAGTPTWLIHDPLQSRFIQIDAAAHETLAAWRECRTVEELIDRVNARGTLVLERASVDALIGFLQQNKLTIEAPRDGWRHFASEHARARRSAWAWLIHNYLFFRIPLWHPQSFLERTLPAVRWLGSRAVTVVVGLLGAAGIYLVSREWEAYSTTFQNLFTWEGALVMAAALLAVKAAHELGHAYTAVRFGCRVPTIGVAFMLLAPLLYTDVTDAWRLRDRRQRLSIDSAGIRVEIAIAALALFLWAFLPDGPMRSLAFVLSAASVVSSLVINLNPFMRFDGYYLLSELLGIENLQARAFVLGRWKLRSVLLGIARPCSEQLPRWQINTLIAYAYLTWAYRLALFIGIALIVYHYFFKVLGVTLFLAEIVYFVLRPVWSEIVEWWALRTEIARSRRALATLACAAAMLLLASLPWSTRVEIPAVIEARELQQVYPPRPARILAVHVLHGARVAAGDPLVTLSSPDIEQEIALARVRLRLAELKYARRGADAIDRESSIVLENEITALASRIEGLQRELEELVLRAPFAGSIVELNAELHAGRWVRPSELVAVVADRRGAVLKGYVPEADLWRIAPGSDGRFVPDQVDRPGVPVTVSDVALGSSSTIEILDLASTFGGRVGATSSGTDRLVPAAAQYLVQLSADHAADHYELAARGMAIVAGKPESLLARAWRQSLKVMLREGGA